MFFFKKKVTDPFFSYLSPQKKQFDVAVIDVEIASSGHNGYVSMWLFPFQSTKIPIQTQVNKHKPIVRDLLSPPPPIKPAFNRHWWSSWTGYQVPLANPFPERICQIVWVYEIQNISGTYFSFLFYINLTMQLTFRYALKQINCSAVSHIALNALG